MSSLEEQRTGKLKLPMKAKRMTHSVADEVGDDRQVICELIHNLKQTKKTYSIHTYIQYELSTPMDVSCCCTVVKTTHPLEDTYVLLLCATYVSNVDGIVQRLQQQTRNRNVERVDTCHVQLMHHSVLPPTVPCRDTASHLEMLDLGSYEPGSSKMVNKELTAKWSLSKSRHDTYHYNLVKFKWYSSS